MAHFNKHIILLGIVMICLHTNAQNQQTLSEKLGYKKDAKLLIVHADDIGLAHSVNKASIIGFENSGITSGSIMVPCPWFYDFAEYARNHPGLDVGIHTTLTAEWDFYKFDGVLPANEIPSLLDENGYFYPTVEKVSANAKPAEVEKEIRAQIERAIAFGIEPTHLDTHMGSILATPQLTEIYLRLGKEYHLPVFIPRAQLANIPEELSKKIAAENILVEGFFMMYEEKPDVSWSQAYRKMMDMTQTGLNLLIVHLAIDDAEMQAVAINHPDFGSAWRQRDLDFVSSQEFKNMLKKNDIQLVSWKAIQAVM